MWFSGEDRLRKGPKEMEEQKQAERQWNKIRRERINILKEAPSEENLWQAVMAFQDYPFKTVTGLPFQYTLKTGKNGAQFFSSEVMKIWGGEFVIDSIKALS